MLDLRVVVAATVVVALEVVVPALVVFPAALTLEKSALEQGAH